MMPHASDVGGHTASEISAALGRPLWFPSGSVHRIRDDNHKAAVQDSGDRASSLVTASLAVAQEAIDNMY
jgi:hypothetical protein